MNTTVAKDSPFGSPEPESIIFINPKKDIYKAKTVLGPAKKEVYKEQLINDLVRQIVNKFDPQIEEKNGYEILSYSLIIKPYNKEL